MKKHVMINLSENDILVLRTIARLKGLTLSAYIELLARTAVVYHNIHGQEDNT